MHYISMNIVDNFDRKLDGRPSIYNLIWDHCVLSSISCMNIFVIMYKYIDEVGDTELGGKSWSQRMNFKTKEKL